MKAKLKKLLQNTTSRYIIIGVGIYLIELVIIVIAQHYGARDTVAVGISFWLGLMISFFLQKILTFGDTRMHHKVLVPQLLAVTCLVLFNFGFTIVVTRLLRNHVPAVGTRTIALGVTTIWNFYLYRKRIFKTGTAPLID